MSRNKKKYFGVIALATMALASCSEPVYLPEDYDKPLFDNIPGDRDVVQNDREDYYNSVMSSDAVYQKVVKDILLKIATIGHDYTGKDTGKNVFNVIADMNDKSVADQGKPSAANVDNLLARAKESLLDTAASSSYTKDNLFYEEKYVNALISSGSLPADFVNNATDGILVGTHATFDEVFKNDYTAYMKESLYGDTTLNYLAAEYIYNVSYSSIGNTNARKLQIVAMEDRSDLPGAAKDLLDCYIRDFVQQKYASQSYSGLDAAFFVDEDFSVLERLWKGITKDVADYLEAGRYDAAKVVLTDKEEAWLRANGLLNGSFTVAGSNVTNTLKSKTLMGKILDDMRKLAIGNENYNRVDPSLESSYTGSYSYSTDVGVRKAVDTLATKELITDGIHLKADSLGSIPSDLKERIFSPKVSTKKSVVDDMKNNKGKRNDYTVYQEDGYRYITKSETLNVEAAADDIVYFDSGSSTYYLVRVLDAVDTNALNKKNADSIYETAEKKEQIAREVAYAMSTTGSYKTDSAVFWLSRCKIDYSDEDFLEYMKTTYTDIFKTKNPYADTEQYPEIILPDTDAGHEGV